MGRNWHNRETSVKNRKVEGRIGHVRAELDTEMSNQAEIVWHSGGRVTTVMAYTMPAIFDC